MIVDHLGNYRRALPFGVLFAAVSVAAIVIFIVYAAKWNELSSSDRFTTDEKPQGYEERTRAEYGYYASVISLLVLIVFFNGYHLTKL